jgi:hypothetical protein
VTDELGALDELAESSDHADAERLLTAHGWTRCGVGDWAVVLASPSGALAARISPFDPVAPYTVELFRQAAATRQVPVLHAYVELEGGAVCTVMERLHPIETEQGSAFFAALQAREPHLADLAEALDRVVELARAELPWCGPLDPNPANVMRRAHGDLVLTDPFYADGPNLFGSLVTDASQVARKIPAERRRHMFELPLAESGPWDDVERRRLRSRLAQADARIGAEDPA